MCHTSFLTDWNSLDIPNIQTPVNDNNDNDKD